MISSVAIFCGSQNGKNPIYLQHAKTLGTLLAQNNIHIVYGGGNAGIMGAIANSCLDNGGQVTGIIPRMLVEKEHAHTQLSQIHIVEDMHTRKQMMYSLCEAILILPGGNGTLDEMFETITWNVLNIHNKRIILLNTAGFYDALIKHMEIMRQEGFLYTPNKVILCNSPEEIIERLKLTRD
ncbi:LOG family protein [Arachidicoccus soli]|uniref:Cytokinin riboside 5'-monophosphate phosphoribohydrolase n=1 Tax=Arachidicoccus soli TaxID=2341117 RepID=A0A386HQP9_9BACT|nr:TIGR00730 family Rossman fold protein [Arachidicoccus soli]AYD48175.1 TIGR00730 family Rossman fold protein [Arachidicoccus soli]